MRDIYMQIETIYIWDQSYISSLEVGSRLGVAGGQTFESYSTAE